MRVKNRYSVIWKTILISICICSLIGGVLGLMMGKSFDGFGWGALIGWFVGEFLGFVISSE